MTAEPGITQIHKQKVQAGMCPLMSQVGTWKIPVRYKSKKCFTMTVVKYSTSHPERLWDFPSSEMLKAGLNKSLSKLISVQLKVGLSCSRGASQPKLFLGPLTKLPDLLFTPLFLPPPPHVLLSPQHGWSCGSLGSPLAQRPSGCGLQDSHHTLGAHVF